MKDFFSSLYGKIATAFVVIILLIGAGQLGNTVRSCIYFEQNAINKMNAPLAGQLAEAIAPGLQDSIHYAEIAMIVDHLRIGNPNIAVYLLDESGDIVAQFAGDTRQQGSSGLPTKNVDIAVVKNFIKNSEAIRAGNTDASLLLGENPRAPGHLCYFSAAALPNNSQAHYLYALTGEPTETSAWAMISENAVARSTVLILLGTLLAAGLLGIYLFGRLTRRFREIGESVKQFGQGDLTRRIPIHGNDDLGALASTFNDMANTIERHIQTIEIQDQLRRDLVTNLSHDLRSPLAAIQGYLETVMIKDDQLSLSKRQQFMEKIFENVQQLNNQVNQLLELSQLNAEGKSPRAEPFAISELIQDIVLKFKPQAEKLNVTLAVDLPNQLPMAYGDIGLIEKAISNLIENALHYSSEADRIKIEVGELESTLQIKISDRGAGIPPEDMPHIFDQFYRGDKSRSRRFGSGSGLGLTITKQIIEAHNGSISVDSAVNRGTSFRLELPIFN